MRSRRASQARHLAGMIAVLGLLCSFQAAPASASRQGVAPDACVEKGTIRAAQLPARVSSKTCDLVGRYVESGTVRLQVPLPGEGVGAAAVGRSGESELVIITDPNGDVLINEGGEEASALVMTTPPMEPCDRYGVDGCLAPCADDNFNTYSMNPKVKAKQPWFFKASSTPASMTAAESLTAIKAGTRNIVTGNNDCQLPDPLSQTAPYKGATTRGTGISVAGTGSSRTNMCGRANGVNVVDFGSLAGELGLTCWRIRMNTIDFRYYIVEADIRLMKSAPWTLSPNDPACSNRFDLQGLVTHERGHAFGLDHADSGRDAHSHQTMYVAPYPCSSYWRTLGLGDHSGLAFLY